MYKCIKNIQGNPLKKEQCTILLSVENQRIRAMMESTD